MFSANILKNRNTPFFEKTKPKKNTTNWKWPSRYPPSDTAKLLAIFVWNPPALCISSAIYPERKPVRVSSDLCYQPLTRPYRSHVTVPQVHHLSRGPAGGGVTPLARWAQAPVLPLISTRLGHQHPCSRRQLLYPWAAAHFQLPLKVTCCGRQESSNFSGGCFWCEERVSVELLPPQRGEPQERERNPGRCCHPLKGSGGLAPCVPHTIAAIAVPSLFLHHRYFWW